MSRPAAAAVELDFLGLGTMNSQQRNTTLASATATPKPQLSQFQKFLERGRSFRGLQSSSGGAVSREAMMPNLFSPEVLKSVIVAGNSYENVPEKPKAKHMTVFYGGHVSVYDVTHDQFESIVKLAMEGRLESARAAGDRPQEAKQQPQMVNLKDPLNEDLPLARRKSLQRFLEKRKERLNTSSPYAWHYY